MIFTWENLVKRFLTVLFCDGGSVSFVIDPDPDLNFFKADLGLTFDADPNYKNKRICIESILENKTKIRIRNNVPVILLLLNCYYFDQLVFDQNM